jgi:hypothetical protein
VEQVAATVGHFKQSIAEMQALLQQLQGLDLDDDSTQEIHKLLAAHPAPSTQRQAAAAAGSQAAEGSQGRPADQAHAGSTCSSNSSSMLPPVPLQQRLQQEVLQSISELHATITGLSLVPSGGWVVASRLRSRLCMLAQGMILQESVENGQRMLSEALLDAALLCMTCVCDSPFRRLLLLCMQMPAPLKHLQGYPHGPQPTAAAGPHSNCASSSTSSMQADQEHSRGIMCHSQEDQGAHVTPHKAVPPLHRPWLLQACRRSSCVHTSPTWCCSGWGLKLRLAVQPGQSKLR